MIPKYSITFSDALIAASNLLNLDLGDKNGSLQEDWNNSPYSREDFIATELDKLAKAIYAQYQ